LLFYLFIYLFICRCDKQTKFVSTLDLANNCCARSLFLLKYWAMATSLWWNTLIMSFEGVTWG